MQNQDILVVMQKDLERALAAPDTERRWAMLIDLRKCVGCHACTVGCVSENKLPPVVIPTRAVKVKNSLIFGYRRGWAVMVRGRAS